MGSRSVADNVPIGFLLNDGQVCFLDPVTPIEPVVERFLTGASMESVAAEYGLTVGQVESAVRAVIINFTIRRATPVVQPTPKYMRPWLFLRDRMSH